MKTSKDSNSASSCSGILRRLLCAGCTTQTHSTVVPDHSHQIQFITPTTKSIHQDVVVKTSSSSNPGVVARLMGLESFPEPTTPGHTTLGALLRSRSVNSIDFLVHFDPGFLPHHRRVRTAISFTQVRLDDGGDDVKKWQKRQKGDILQEKKGAAARKVEMIREVRNRSKKKDFQSTRTQVKKQLEKNEMRVWRRRNKNRVDPRRRVRSREPPVLSENGIFQGACGKKKTSKGDDERRSRMVEEICRVTEEDVKENWDPKFEDFEGEICREFGQEILHALMKQLIDELYSFY